MRDGVRRNEIFKAVQVFQDVLFHDLGTDTFGDRLEYPVQHFQQKGPRAGSEIQHGHALVVGQTLVDAEGVFQEVVYLADDEVHDRWRGVIDTARLAGVLVIGFQEVLVEIDIRVSGKQQAFFLCGRKQPTLSLGKGQVLMNGGQVQRV